MTRRMRSGWVDLAEVQVAEDGTVTGVDNALKTLTKAKPHLVKTTSGGGGSTSTVGGRQTCRWRMSWCGRSGHWAWYTPIQAGFDKLSQQCGIRHLRDCEMRRLVWLW